MNDQDLAVDMTGEDSISLQVLMQQYDKANSVNSQTKIILATELETKTNNSIIIEMVPRLIDSVDEDLEDEAALSISKNQDQATKTTFRCTCCTNDGLDVTKDLGWSHSDCETLWCVDCLESTLKSGLEGYSAFPPSCCDFQLNLEDVLPFLVPDQRAIWEERSMLASMTQPLYCAKATCSQLLGDATKLRADNVKYVDCDTCKTSTCLDCKQAKPEHNAADTCPTESLSTLTVNLLAMNFGENEDGNTEIHRQCICGNILSRRSGCLHVTCLICLRELCMGCGRLWFLECTCNDAAEAESSEAHVEVQAQRIDAEATLNSDNDEALLSAIEWQTSIDDTTDRPDVQW